jgi:hypothetical protein
MWLMKYDYKLYCKILSRLIKEAKKQQYSRRISISKNKVTTICNVVKLKQVGKLEKNNNINKQIVVTVVITNCGFCGVLPVAFVYLLSN